MQHKDFDYKECNDLTSIEASIIAPEISHFEPPIIQPCDQYWQQVSFLSAIPNYKFHLGVIAQRVVLWRVS